MDFRAAVSVTTRLPRRAPRAGLERLSGPVETVGFWGAIALPAGYLALLASGIDSQSGLGLFLGLLGLHLTALVVGHDHRRARDEPPGAGRR